MLKWIHPHIAIHGLKVSPTVDNLAKIIKDITSDPLDLECEQPVAPRILQLWEVGTKSYIDLLLPGTSPNSRHYLCDTQALLGDVARRSAKHKRWLSTACPSVAAAILIIRQPSPSQIIFCSWIRFKFTLPWPLKPCHPLQQHT